MTYCEDYKVAGKALLAPDQGVELTQTDVDASDAGRDESGFMHRHVVRRRVKSWNFVYSFLSKEELAYLESLFDGLDSFQFTYPGENGPATCTAYCSNNSVTVQNLRLGVYRNFKFSVIEC